MRRSTPEYEGLLRILHICMVILVCLFFVLLVLCLWNICRLLREIVGHALKSLFGDRSSTTSTEPAAKETSETRHSTNGSGPPVDDGAAKAKVE